MGLIRDIFALLLLLPLLLIGCSRDTLEEAGGRDISELDDLKAPITVFGRLSYVEGDSLPVIVSVPKQVLADDVADEFRRLYDALPVDEFEVDEAEGDVRLATLEWVEFRRGDELILGSTAGSILVRRSSDRYWVQSDSVHEALLKWCKDGRVQNEEQSLPPMVE